MALMMTNQLPEGVFHSRLIVSGKSRLCVRHLVLNTRGEINDRDQAASFAKNRGKERMAKSGSTS